MLKSYTRWCWRSAYRNGQAAWEAGDQVELFSIQYIDVYQEEHSAEARVEESLSKPLVYKALNF